jgi:2-(1,2-epoxy-1,2-dihydrophenyl)acetyl-CoA isomerase
MYKTILFELADQILTVTLHRPEVYNAFDDEMSFELQDALKKAARDEQVRVVVLTGAGDKAFSSGQDLNADRGDDPKRFSDSLHRRYNPIIRAICAMPRPVICRLNGVAAGAGCSLALACDVIIAAESASLALGFINIGLVPDSGATYFLPRAVGYHKAFELVSRGGRISATEALQLGLVNRVEKAADLDAAVQGEASYYAGAPTRAVALIKKMLRKGATESLDAALAYEAYCQQIAGGTADHKEGRDAFLEKRKAIFRGR